MQAAALVSPDLISSGFILRVHLQLAVCSHIVLMSTGASSSIPKTAPAKRHLRNERYERTSIGDNSLLLTELGTRFGDATRDALDEAGRLADTRRI